MPIWQLRAANSGQCAQTAVPNLTSDVRLLDCRSVVDKLAFLSPGSNPFTLGGMAMTPDSRIYVAGNRGMVGSAIWRQLEGHGFKKLIGRTRSELDLLDPGAVEKFYSSESPEYVIVAAAKVGGIKANDARPAEFLFQNLQIQN